MFNVCPHCGEYCVEKIIEPSELGSSKTAYAICPFCRYAHPFLRQPLFVITGASGAGKSTVCLTLVQMLKECVVMDKDILWGMISATPKDDYHTYPNVWLRIAKNIGQAGKPVVLCGTALPEQFETCPERRYFSALHYLVMVCNDDLLVERLHLRPAWRHNDLAAVVEDMLQFNRWLREHADKTVPTMTLNDTSHRSTGETTEEIAHWIRQRL